MSTSIINARIEGTFLGVEDHGILSCQIHLTLGGCCQSFGGYSLDTKPVNGTRRGTAWGMEFVRRVIATVGADSWEKLPHKYLRVERTDHMIKRIGHITDDVWFCPETDLKHLEGQT